MVRYGVGRELRTGIVLASALTVMTVGAGPAVAAQKVANTAVVKKLGMVLETAVPDVRTAAIAAQAAATSDGVNSFSIVAPTTYDLAKQEELSNSLVSSGVQGIEEQLLTPSAWARDITAAQAQGVAIVDTGLFTGPFLGAKTPLYVGITDTEYGASLAKMTVQALGPNAHGSVVLTSCVSGETFVTVREQTFEKDLKAAEPGVTVLGPYMQTDSYTQGVTDAAAIVDAHPNMLATTAICSTAASDMAKVKLERHLDFKIIGAELDPHDYAYVKSGVIYGVTGSPNWEQGYVGMKVIYNELTNPAWAHLSGWVGMPMINMTKANVSFFQDAMSTNATQEAYFEGLGNAVFANFRQRLQPWNTGA
jgi:ABC-type sugar transport system substrate-binding protein